MSYKTAIFDLDGTLLNTLEDLWHSTNLALVHYGWLPRTEDEVRLFVGNGTKVLLDKAIPGGVRNPKFKEAMEYYEKTYGEHQFDNTQPYAGIPEALKELARRGVKMAIVSNKPDFAVKDLNRKFFGLPIACGDKEGQNRKPAPDVVFAAMKELGADPGSTVYIGDSEVDIETAKNAGLPCISATWGFRSREWLTGHGAETFADTPGDLVKLISE